MTVNSGINREKKDIYGLAHFCEHMLFLGSKKYPNSTHFVDFITLYGGKFNGYTDFENTGFFFTINSERFNEAFDIFSRFFIDPLFSGEYVEKEVNSVNSEFERNIQLDSKRKEMVLRQIANADSLFHRFSTGNKKTLLQYAQKNNIDLKEKVYQFYKNNYRPDNMKLIVYGNKPIDIYKDLVNTIFSEINAPHGSIPEKQFTKLPWKPFNIGKLVLYNTINEHQELDINFMVDDIFKTLPDNSALYYKILLNYKGKGSLDDILRRHGLVAGIKAYLRKTHEGFSFFKIRGYITTRGIINLDKVLSIIFKYINYVRIKSIDKELFEYTKKIFDIAFFFNNKKKKLTKYMKSLCGILWKYNSKYWFSQHKILNEYSQEKIKIFGEKLVLKNAIVLLGNKIFDENLIKRYPEFVEEFKENEELIDQDPFYNTRYTQKNFKEKFIEKMDKFDEKIESNSKHMKLFAHKKILPNIISLKKQCKNSNRKKVN